MVIPFALSACSKPRSPSSERVAPSASTPSPTGVSASPPRANPPEPSAKELSNQADKTLATILPDDIPRLLEALESPNRYLRAGALSRLAQRSPALSREALHSVIALLNDYDRITSGVCLQYESGGVLRGQGTMLIAAECAHDHTETVSARAKAVLVRAEPRTLAQASVWALGRQPALAEPLSTLVRARGQELAGPLQRELVEAEHAGQPGEVDAALQLLANVGLGLAEPEASEVLRRLAGELQELRAVRATCVLLALSYRDPPPVPVPAWARDGYDFLRGKLALEPEFVCPRGANCVSVYVVLSEVRALREAAGPLLPELIAFLESPNASLHIPSLLVLKAMGAKARPAVPKLVALLARDPQAGSDDIDGETFFVLEAIAAARPSPASVKRSLLRTVRRDPARFDDVAAVLVAVNPALTPSERQVFRRAYEKSCADAGSIANFSFSHDDRCAKAAHDLETLGVRTHE